MSRLFALLVLIALPASGDTYLNCGDSESGHNAASTTLWCDDFEDGYWWEAANCDNEGLAANDGWRGYCGNTDSYGDGDHALCSGFGANGTNCAGHKGHEGNSVSLGWHKFDTLGGTGFYFRYYVYVEGESWLEKYIGFGNNATFGGSNTEFGFLDTDFGNDAWKYCNTNQETNGSSPQCWLNNNLATPTITYGHWHFLEIHVQLDTPGQNNGIFEMWWADCGADGLGCTGSPTKVANYTNVDWTPSPNGATTIDWISLWGWQPDSQNYGLRKYDQIVASTTGPIGFMGGGGSPPAAPTLQGASITGGALSYLDRLRSLRDAFLNTLTVEIR